MGGSGPHRGARGAREQPARGLAPHPEAGPDGLTGISGSGESSLVFGTIAAESQRLINETYTAFLQSLMPNVGRPDVARPRVGDAVGRRGAAGEDGAPPRLEPDRRHLCLRRADDRPAPARRRARQPAAGGLRDKGNTVLVVEHKPDVIAIADHVVDMGPGAGGTAARSSTRATSPGLRASGTLTGDHFATARTIKDDVREPSRRAARRARRRCTTCATSPSTSRSACWSPSPASPARARAR